MPPMLTYAARVADGLPLVASFAPSSAQQAGLTESHKREAREILRGLSGNRCVYIGIIAVIACSGDVHVGRGFDIYMYRTSIQ